MNDLKGLKAGIEDRLNLTEVRKIDETIEEFEQGLTICSSSCKLMNFNVEDIMALP